jgi:hypothetical protein
MEIGISELRELAKRILWSAPDHDGSVTDSQVESLTAYTRELGEYEDGMELEEIACIVLLYEIEKEKANRIPSDDRSPLKFRRAR